MKRYIARVSLFLAVIVGFLSRFPGFLATFICRFTLTLSAFFGFVPAIFFQIPLTVGMRSNPP